MSRSILILGLGIVAGVILATTARDRRRHKGRRELKEDVERWEDEGGNVPEVATVSPGAAREPVVPATPGYNGQGKP